MKKVLLYLFSFCLGIAAMFVLGSYSPGDIKLAFSDSLDFANGSSYKGSVDKQGRLDGYGRLAWSNGDSYEGEFASGLFQGKGKLVSAGSLIYEGDFDQGYMSGQGVMVYQNGSRYQGQFEKNNFQGRGVLTRIDGSVYEGDFQINEMTGFGKLTNADKSSYLGEIKNGLFDGKGEWVLGDGLSYSGDFVKGKMHGKGVYRINSNGSYSGEFLEGEFSGMGVHITEDGDILQGKFLKWWIDGPGVKTDKEGNQWKGSFKYGELYGAGVYTGKDGELYSGEFKHGSYSGKGKLIDKNGDIYEGEFDYGQKDGKGLLTYKEPTDGIVKIHGRWQNDRLVEGDANLKIYSPAEISSYAMEQQQADLSEALAKVQPSNPNKVELYSLVVAAYGTQEVFRRESKFIENLFSQRYENNTTAVYLTNSQRSLGEHPLATLSSIERSILQITEKMDKEKDVFFLYITSHGSKDKKISLNHSGLGLGDIDSKWLGDILKKSGIKHKVIVLSACYSGGFIDDLKDSHSIIMTSASSERTSFGCSDDSQFTYFAKAYFKESLTPDSNFVDAFYKAKELVALWEKNEHEKESYPQIYVATKVSDYVKKWKPAQ